MFWLNRMLHMLYNTCVYTETVLHCCVQVPSQDERRPNKPTLEPEVHGEDHNSSLTCSKMYYDNNMPLISQLLFLRICLFTSSLPCCILLLPLNSPSSPFAPASPSFPSPPHPFISFHLSSISPLPSQSLTPSLFFNTRHPQSSLSSDHSTA